MATQADVLHLMASWASDPIWDIQDTPGYQDHYAELVAFSRQKHAEWEARRQVRVLAKAEALGVPDNTTLALAWLAMEDRIRRLEEAIGRD